MELVFTWYSNTVRLRAQQESTLQDGETIPWPSINGVLAFEEAVTRDTVLQRIFRVCNRVDGSDIEQVPEGWPSMSVGDVVTVDFEGLFYCCTASGWSVLADATSFMEKDPQKVMMEALLNQI